MKTLSLLPGLGALLLFPVLFQYRGLGPLDFWNGLAAILVVLIALAARLDPGLRRAGGGALASRPVAAVLIGLGSAVLLYVIFLVGNIMVRRIVDFAGAEIDSVYAFKADASRLRIGLLMLMVIGPGEEILWRAHLQRRLAERCGPWRGFALATGCYTVVHLATGNLVLIAAALTCGLFWGWLWLKFRSPLTNMVSHTAWDIAVFLVFPFR